MSITPVPRSLFLLFTINIKPMYRLGEHYYYIQADILSCSIDLQERVGTIQQDRIPCFLNLLAHVLSASLNPPYDFNMFSYSHLHI